jgi:hypothetical protein
VVGVSALELIHPPKGTEFHTLGTNDFPHDWECRTEEQSRLTAIARPGRPSDEATRIATESPSEERPILYQHNGHKPTTDSTVLDDDAAMLNLNSQWRGGTPRHCMWAAISGSARREKALTNTTPKSTLGNQA